MGDLVYENFSLGELFVVQIMGLRGESMDAMTFGNHVKPFFSSVQGPTVEIELYEINFSFI